MFQGLLYSAIVFAVAATEAPTGVEPIKVVVTPKKAGIYKITRSVPCGSGHGDMVVTVDVEP